MSEHSQWHTIAQQGFLFSGTISAAVSHEIRNKLAVVNEKAGLIEDLARMYAKGRPVDPEQLEAQARGIREQVRRADSVVEHLNQFAHSADRPCHRTDVAQLLALMVALSERRASTAGVRLALTQPSAPAMLTTSPFLLENLLFLCIELALSAADEAKEIGVGVETAAEGIRVRFSGLDQADDQLRILGETSSATALLDAVQARLQATSGGAELILEADDIGGADELTP